MSFIHSYRFPKSAWFQSNKASFTRIHFWTKREHWWENIKLGSQD